MTNIQYPPPIGPAQPGPEPVTASAPLEDEKRSTSVSRRMLAMISAAALVAGLLLGGGVGVAVGSTLAPDSTTVSPDQTGFRGNRPDGIPGTGTVPDPGTDTDSGTGTGTTT